MVQLHATNTMRRGQQVVAMQKMRGELVSRAVCTHPIIDVSTTHRALIQLLATMLTSAHMAAGQKENGLLPFGAHYTNVLFQVLFQRLAAALLRRVLLLDGL